MKERRRWVRVAIKVDIAYTECRSPEKEKLSFSKDISRGGVCLIISEELQESGLLDLKIYLTKDETPIKVRGRVAWIHEFTGDDVSKQEKAFYAGIEFMEIDEEGGRKIDEYIASALQIE